MISMTTFIGRSALEETKTAAKEFFAKVLNLEECDCLDWITGTAVAPSIRNDDQALAVGDFILSKNPDRQCSKTSGSFIFETDTVVRNVLKVLRGMSSGAANKPILLEGTPGVGKSSLVSALASFTGNTLVRINLSDQTEVSDLFGSDLPVSSESGDGMAAFAWQDGPFLSGILHQSRPHQTSHTEQLIIHHTFSFEVWSLDPVR